MSKMHNTNAETSARKDVKLSRKVANEIDKLITRLSNTTGLDEKIAICCLKQATALVAYLDDKELDRAEIYAQNLIRALNNERNFRKSIRGGEVSC